LIYDLEASGFGVGSAADFGLYATDYTSTPAPGTMHYRLLRLRSASDFCPGQRNGRKWFCREDLKGMGAIRHHTG